MTHHNQSKQSGNVLWFILIAVGLLGALTMVITNSSKNSAQTGDVERNRIETSKVLRYAKNLENAVQQLIISGCSENEINFENTTDTNYENTDAPSDQSCDIFAVSGTGREWQTQTGQRFSGGEGLIVTGAITVQNIEENTRAELLALIPVSQGLCTQVNRDLGISTDAADITSDIASYTKFTGGFTNGSDIIGTIAGKAPALADNLTGCFIDDNGRYIAYHTLLAR